MPRDGDDFWVFPPYVSAATRRALAARALAALARKKKGWTPEPIAAQRRRALTSTFWGKAWCDNLERYADFANRLPRGRTYARNGSVVHLAIGKGSVEARVSGSELYETTIRITPLAKTRWRRVVGRCTGKIGSLVGLLRGELSADVLSVLAHPKEGLFPEPREMTFQCSCPDAAEMCKHVAAVLYGVGVRLDQTPALFFTLREVDEAELLSSAVTGLDPRIRASGGKRIAADKLADVFGIELEHDRAVKPHAAPKPRPRATSSRRAPWPPRRRAARSAP